MCLGLPHCGNTPTSTEQWLDSFRCSTSWQVACNCIPACPEQHTTEHAAACLLPGLPLWLGQAQCSTHDHLGQQPALQHTTGNTTAFPSSYNKRHVRAEGHAQQNTANTSQHPLAGTMLDWHQDWLVHTSPLSRVKKLSLYRIGVQVSHLCGIHGEAADVGSNIQHHCTREQRHLYAAAQHIVPAHTCIRLVLPNVDL